MIWYLHWLELRSRLLGGLIVMAIVSVVFAFAQQQYTRVYHDTGKFIENFKALQPAATPETAQAILTVATHSQMVWMTLFWVMVMMAGNGLAGRNTNRITQALPVSRLQVLDTRLLAGASGVALCVLVHLALNVGWLAVSGKVLPWAAMAEFSLFGFVLTLPALPLTALLLLYFEQTWVVPAVAIAGVTVLTLTSFQLTQFVASPPTSIWWVTAIAATMVLVAVTRYLAVRRSFDS